MISNEELDGVLTLIKYHNTIKNQSFSTIWLSDMNPDKMREIVLTLKSFGYITIDNPNTKNERKCLLQITADGMKLLQNGGFVALERNNRMKKIKMIVYIIISILTLSISIIGLLFI